MKCLEISKHSTNDNTKNRWHIRLNGNSRQYFRITIGLLWIEATVEEKLKILNPKTF